MPSRFLIKLQTLGENFFKKKELQIYTTHIKDDSSITFTLIETYLRIPARRSSFGIGKSTPDIDVTLSKKSNSLWNKSRALGVKLSIIRCLTRGSNA